MSWKGAELMTVTFTSTTPSSSIRRAAPRAAHRPANPEPSTSTSVIGHTIASPDRARTLTRSPAAGHDLLLSSLPDRTNRGAMPTGPRKTTSGSIRCTRCLIVALGLGVAAATSHGVAWAETHGADSTGGSADHSQSTAGSATASSTTAAGSTSSGGSAATQQVSSPSLSTTGKDKGKHKSADATGAKDTSAVGTSSTSSSGTQISIAIPETPTPTPSLTLLAQGAK